MQIAVSVKPLYDGHFFSEIYASRRVSLSNSINSHSQVMFLSIGIDKGPSYQSISYYLVSLGLNNTKINNEEKLCDIFRVTPI